MRVGTKVIGFLAQLQELVGELRKAFFGFDVDIISKKLRGEYMETIKEWLLGLDTLILVFLIWGAFIVWELRSGEVPLRWFGSIRRDTRPFFYWMGILLHMAVLGLVIYSWMIGIRMPVSGLFD